ncbi:MAG: hypothetical protein JNL70_14335 [Saprospiraceae bacterium]|nr:hypothetical protein [Saprospiraceae bacterium]
MMKSMTIIKQTTILLGFMVLMIRCKDDYTPNVNFFVDDTGCEYPNKYRDCYDFSQVIKSTGKSVDSTVYLNEVVGNWRIHCYRQAVYPGPTGNPGCSEHFFIDDPNRKINLVFKPDFSFSFLMKDSASPTGYRNAEGKLSYSNNRFYYTNTVSLWAYFHLSISKVSKDKLSTQFYWGGDYYFIKE